MATTGGVSGSDTVTGSSGSEVLVGGAGSDTIDGGAGNDFISSGSGSDTVDGGSGSDTINAGSGNDTLIYTYDPTAVAKDVYIGGSGVDKLILNIDSADWTSELQTKYTEFLDKIDAALAARKTGEIPSSEKLTFTFTFPNGSTLTTSMIESIDLQVTTSNQAPVTTPVALTPIAEDGATRLITQAELLANASDSDGNPMTATGLAIASGQGLLVDNGNGTWNYTPASNDDTSVNFSYTIDDGDLTVGGSATLDITPVNDVATITGSHTGTVIEDWWTFKAGGSQYAKGTLTVNDVDAGEAAFQSVSASSLEGTYGDFTFDSSTGKWTYHLDANSSALASLHSGSSGVDALTVTSLDGTATRTIMVTVNGAGELSVQSGSSLTGTNGDDLLLGTAGIDNINGGSGNDVIFGFGGNDGLTGNNDSDVLFGGAGSDTMTGNNGIDYFVFNTAIGSDIDTINSFNASQDFIALDLSVFGALAPSATPGDRLALADSQFVTSASLDTQTDARIVFNTTTGALYFDTDGGDLTTAATHFATVNVNSGTVLDKTDFVLFLG